MHTSASYSSLFQHAWDGTLKVRGRGSLERMVPIRPALSQRIRRYLNGRDAEGQERVFVALRKGIDRHYSPITKKRAVSSRRSACWDERPASSAVSIAIY